MAAPEGFYLVKNFEVVIWPLFRSSPFFREGGTIEEFHCTYIPTFYKYSNHIFGNGLSKKNVWQNVKCLAHHLLLYNYFTIV